MAALAIPAITSLLPGLLSSLFGGNEQAKLQALIQHLMNPQNQANLANQFYQQNLASPAYSQAQRGIAQGVNQTSNQVGANLAARGIGTSGSAAVLSGLSPSLLGSQLAGLRTQAYTAGQGQAQGQLEAQLKALMEGYGKPSQTQNLFSGGLAALAPYLMKFLQPQAQTQQPTGQWTSPNNRGYLPSGPRP